MSSDSKAQCSCCGASFVCRAAGQKFCSSRCRYRDRERKRAVTGFSRAEYLAQLSKAAAQHRTFECVQCGRVAQRKLGGTNKSAGYANKYCSLDCRDTAYRAAALSRRLAANPCSSCFARYCICCASPFVTRTQRRTCGPACAARAAGQAAHRATARTVVCDECSASFCPLYGATHATLCGLCAEARRRIHKRVQRLARKARQRGATVESVNPIRVFERDGWLCQICGISTPRSKRGTYADDAPELDHIIALARGGEHSYRNTQCACRRCNGLKSDRPVAEMTQG